MIYIFNYTNLVLSKKGKIIDLDMLSEVGLKTDGSYQVDIRQENIDYPYKAVVDERYRDWDVILKKNKVLDDDDTIFIDSLTELDDSHKIIDLYSLDGLLKLADEPVPLSLNAQTKAFGLPTIFEEVREDGKRAFLFWLASKRKFLYKYVIDDAHDINFQSFLRANIFREYGEKIKTNKFLALLLAQLYLKHEDSSYKTYHITKIPKKSKFIKEKVDGTTRVKEIKRYRTIYDPDDRIRPFLKRVANELKFKAPYKLQRAATKYQTFIPIFAYVKDRNIKYNAMYHKKNKFIMKMDISQMFENLNIDDVCSSFRYLFFNPIETFNDELAETQGHNSTYLKNNIHNLIGRRSTYGYYRENATSVDDGWTNPINLKKMYEDNQVMFRELFFTHLKDNGHGIKNVPTGIPTGSPVSPFLAVLAMKPILVKLIRGLEKHFDEKDNLLVSLYADDFTFSMNRKFTKEDRAKIIKLVRWALPDHLKINYAKNKLMTNNKRRITGVRVNHNDKVTIDRSKYRLLRSMLYNLHKNKDYEDFFKKEEVPFKNKESFLGTLNYYLYIDETGKFRNLVERYQTDIDNL